MMDVNNRLGGDRFEQIGIIYETEEESHLQNQHTLISEENSQIQRLFDDLAK